MVTGKKDLNKDKHSQLYIKVSCDIINQSILCISILSLFILETTDSYDRQASCRGLSSHVTVSGCNHTVT